MHVPSYLKIYINRIFKYYDNERLLAKRMLALCFVVISPWRYFKDKVVYPIRVNRHKDQYFTLDKHIGFMRVNLPDELIQQVVSNAQNTAKSLSKNDKPYLRALTDISDYDIDSPEMTLATDPKLLKSVQQYLGHTPYLYDITALHSPSATSQIQKMKINQSERFQGSQLFHRDGDDLRILKVWVLCSNVSDKNGPTTLLGANDSEKIARKIKYRQESKMPIDQERKLHLDILSYKKATGDIGTTFVTDTVRLLHFGSRTLEENERLVLMFHYVSFYSCYFRKFARRGKRKMLHPSTKFNQLSDIQKIALRGYLN